jgi:succinate dehydrogenase / fumarate reductase flavoprotein subunit
VSKGRAGRSGATLLAGADLTFDGRSLREFGFPGAPDDSPEKWMNDIVTQGFYLNNQRLVEVYVRDAARRVGELLDRGLEVLGSAERAIDTTGESIAGVLLRWARESDVEVVDDVMVVDLLLSGGRVAGAFGLDLKTGETMVFRSKSVVMATGGWHKAYDPNAGSRELSGDGVAAAFRSCFRFHMGLYGLMLLLCYYHCVVRKVLNLRKRTKR